MSDVLPSVHTARQAALKKWPMLRSKRSARSFYRKIMIAFVLLLVFVVTDPLKGVSQLVGSVLDAAPTSPRSIVPSMVPDRVWSDRALLASRDWGTPSVALAAAGAAVSGRRRLLTHECVNGVKVSAEGGEHNFPKDLFTPQEKKDGWIVLHIIGTSHTHFFKHEPIV
jgi:hypothetical protein